MGRPRHHDVDDLLDHARRIWVRDGLPGLTLRALRDESGVPNGAIYHAVGSRDGLVARVWCRDADAFLDRQRQAVATAPDPIEAIVAAACTPADLARADPDGATVLLSVRPEDLLTDRLDDTDREQIRAGKRALGEIVDDLAEARWGRRDRTTRALVTMCLVDLPGALLLARGRLTDPLARHALETAVRAIATDPQNAETA